MYLIIISLILVLLAPVNALLSDGLHQYEDYVQFSETQEAFKASCYVYDHHRHILQTGVLITPDIVMTVAHGLEGHLHLHNLIVGFGDTISLNSEHNYEAIAFRTHPRYFTTEFPLQGKYDLLFLKLKTPVRGVKPVPLFEELELKKIPPLYVATFGTADIPRGKPVHRRAFVFPETDIFSVMGRDPEALYDFKTVMMGSIFFEPNVHMKPVPLYGSEKDLRTYEANKQWHDLNHPPYALTLPGSSGAPVFITITQDGIPKTYVFGLIQSYSHLSSSTFKHASGDRETRRLLKGKFHKLYGNYQSVFCLPYKLYQPLKAHTETPKIYRLSHRVKTIIDELDGKPKTKPDKPILKRRAISAHHHGSR